MTEEDIKVLSDYEKKNPAEVMDRFCLFLVEEILAEKYPEVTKEECSKIWDRCAGNPWNAEIVYVMKLFGFGYDT